MPKKKTRTDRKEQKEMSLRDLLVTKLKSLLYIEEQLVKALPKMAKRATDDELKEGFEKHLEQTKRHAERVGNALGILGERPVKLACEGIDGIVGDAGWVMSSTRGDAALDANLIAAAQYAEHYEIAGYTSAVSWAKMLDEHGIADLLQQTLDEERETSEILAEIADSRIDKEAARSGSEKHDR